MPCGAARAAPLPADPARLGGLSPDRRRLRPARAPGGPKQVQLLRLYRLATDGIASSSIRLLRVAQLFSFTFAALTIVLLFALVAMLRSYAEDRMLVLFLVGYILVAAGNFVVTACLYILGAYVGRTYLEAKGRPPYLILEVVGDDHHPKRRGEPRVG